MIVCDRCGKPVNYQSSLKTKCMYNVPSKKEPGQLYPESYGCIEHETHYDLCQECLEDALENLREFVNQGKFNAELNNG